MLSSKFIKFMKALNSGRVENLTCVVDLGRAGLRMAEEYSTRFDLLEVEQCLYLSEFQTPTLEKAEKHLLNLIKKNDPLFSLMEYYDNYPYSYSDINYLFKGCLKSGVEISIKAVNPIAKNMYFKKLYKLEKSLKYHSFFMPWLKKKYRVDEILKDLEEHSKEKFSLGNEIRFTKSMEEYLSRHQDIPFLRRVRFPKIYAYLSSDDKVVTEYVYGTYFYELLSYRRLAYKDVLDLIRIQLFFMLNIGVFHNNLHSGNLILSDEGNIHFLDCNTVSVLETETRKSIFEVLKSITKRNFGELAYQINKLSQVKLSEEDLEKLVTDIKFCFSTNTIQNNTLIIKLMKIFKVASNSGIVFNKDLYPIFKSLIYFDKLVEKTRNKTHSFIEDFEKILEEIEEIIKNNK